MEDRSATKGGACPTKWSQEGRAPLNGHHPRGHPLDKVQDYAEYQEVSTLYKVCQNREMLHGTEEILFNHGNCR